MKGFGLSLVVALALSALTTPLKAAEPDYAEWTRILRTHYDPSKGMDYEQLRKDDYTTLSGLVEELSGVDTSRLARNEQLAYWMNLYNIATVKLIVDHYPVDSILDLSSGLLNRHQVFDQEHVSLGGRTVSLNHIEHEMIRKGFEDPRIHFAINCAALSCPPMRQEAFTGGAVQEQLSDQTTRFLNANTKIDRRGDKATVTDTKIMDWFDDDFDDWGGGVEAFLRKYLSGDTARRLEGVSRVSIKHAGYDWTLNDWKK
jgi:hypothetical protein